jgi:carbonic anhydrase
VDRLLRFARAGQPDHRDGAGGSVRPSQRGQRGGPHRPELPERHPVRVGLADNWLRHVGDVAQKHAAILDAIDDPALRHARLCELNVIEQVANACQSTIVRDAWARGQKLTVHGWVYSLRDGRVREMGIDVESADALQPAYEKALSFVPRKGKRD